jgi:hypothetical protein
MILASNSVHEAIHNIHSAAISSSSSIIAAAPSISDTKRWQPSTSSSSAQQQAAWLLHTPAATNEVVTPTIQQQVSPSSSIYISATTSSTSETTDWTQQLLQLKQSQSTITNDKVKRVIDSSTILLEKSGIVSLDIVRGAGSTYVLPECCTYAPSFKLRQLLKKGTNVKIVNLSSSSGGSASSSAARPKVWIVRSQDDLIVNREIVKSGFGFVRKGASTTSSGGAASKMMMMMDSALLSNFDYEGMMNDLTTLEETARSKGLGIFKVCNNNDGNGNNNNEDGNAITTSNFVAEFEPMEYTTEIQYGDDGGKSVLVSNSAKQQQSSSSSSSSGSSVPPSNPGDVKGCSDFTYYEDALGYYERYYPYYGDVAKLDRDGDGVPCPGLPHTANQDRYRMKVPKTM